MTSVQPSVPLSKQPDDVGEEDLVDYEEEEEPMVPSSEKPSENGKEGTKKYAIIP